MGDLEKIFPASACRKKNIACSTNVIESLWGKKGKKYPAHQIARKKILDDQKSPPPPSRVKWSAPNDKPTHFIHEIKTKGGDVIDIIIMIPFQNNEMVPTVLNSICPETYNDPN